MKATKLFIFAAVALAVAACSTSKENNTESEDLTDAAYAIQPYSGSIAGEWRVTNITCDTISINPNEVTPDEPTVVMFTDSSYHFKTNCNLVQGKYTQSGDSISFSPGMSTRMACPDMSVETTLVELLPQLSTIGIENDSTLRFTSTVPSAYLVIERIK